MRHTLNRRTVLRGMMGGAAVSISLPLLDCFLNTNGTALASGAPLPVRFGTWFWGLGITPPRFFPTTVGKNYELMPETQALAPVKEKVSIFSGFNCEHDGHPNFPHGVGNPVIRSGVAPSVTGQFGGTSFDLKIADAIGANSRFLALDLSAIRGTNSNSGRGAGQMSPSEDTPSTLYARLFGPEFVDPNAATFKQNPVVMARHSALSAVTDDRASLMRKLGAADRARLDQYFTSLRRVENQLAIQLEAPPPMAACKQPGKMAEFVPQVDIESVAKNHRLMTELLAMALMCDQTRTFNMGFNNSQSSLTFLGGTVSHHQLTHEEPVDAKLGYQIEATRMIERIMGEWAYFVSYMDQVKEGDKSLLDNMLVLAHTETTFARRHTVDSLPMMLAGMGGGRVNSGLHVAGQGATVSKVVLTTMQAMGVPVDRWGTGGNEVNRPITELLVS